jgi:hypothetical protein
MNSGRGPPIAAGARQLHEAFGRHGCSSQEPCGAPHTMTPPESDPRVFFASKRTLLAWVRTGLAIIGLGGRRATPPRQPP